MKSTKSILNGILKIDTKMGSKTEKCREYRAKIDFTRRFDKDLRPICARFAPDLPASCARFARELPASCARFARELPPICAKR